MPIPRHASPSSATSLPLLESQPATPFLGQLKTLLGVPRLRDTEPPEGGTPNLPVASEVTVPWDIAYFIGLLKTKLGEYLAGFFYRARYRTERRTKVLVLDRYPEWREQPGLVTRLRRRVAAVVLFGAILLTSPAR